LSSSNLGPVLVRTCLRGADGAFRPIDEISKVGRSVKGAIELRRRAVAPRWDLLQELCAAGIAFFDRLVEIGAPDQYAGARRLLVEARNRGFR
jgi:hypothetical protein